MARLFLQKKTHSCFKEFKLHAKFNLQYILNKSCVIIQVKGRPDQLEEAVAEEYQKDEISSPGELIKTNSTDEETKSESLDVFQSQSADSMHNKSEPVQPEQTGMTTNSDLQPDDTSDEGWQEAFPKGRSPSGRKSSISRKPSLSKLNTTFTTGTQSSRYRGKPTNFTSPRNGVK